MLFETGTLALASIEALTRASTSLTLKFSVKILCASVEISSSFSSASKALPCPSVILPEAINSFISSGNFEEKEGGYFGYIRASNSDPALSSQYPLRSANGIGSNTFANTTDPSAVIVNFSISPLVSIGNIISIGDLLYIKSGSVVTLIGKVTDKLEDIANGENYLVVDTTITNSAGNVIGNLPPETPVYYFFIKNGTAESHGLLGHYAVFTLTNGNTSAVELFAIESEVMKSFP